MNSYMRQQNTVTPDQIHSFVKDKQAWENAISMYQGPDPLDHWYNYICWYENHGHGDPDNKFRETLERCLTIYEHSDYYKQDPRMVRLWLKYIDMQTNPLHFYQVLYQRGVGRQVSSFYIGWANYYESVQAFKEAESVFNLGFQEKAQPYAELHHAHSKFVYGRNMAAQQLQSSPKPAPTAQPQQPAQPHLQIHYDQQQPPQQQQQHQQQINMQPQVYAQAQPQIQNYRQHNSPQPQPIYQHQQQQQPCHYQQQQQLPVQQIPAQQLHTQHNQEHTNSQQQLPPQQPHPQQQQHLYPHGQPHEAATVSIPNTNYVQTYGQQLPAAREQIVQQHAQHHVQSETSKQLSEVPMPTPIQSIRLPRKFASYCRNNHETWKPALTLEEPDDPCRRCHYAKHLVYPAGGIVEYSPEELRAKRYEERLEERRRQLIEKNKIVQQQELNEQWYQEQHEAGNAQQQVYEALNTKQQQQQNQYLSTNNDLDNNNYNNNDGHNVVDNDDENDVDDDEEVDDDGEEGVSDSRHEHYSSPPLNAAISDDLEDQIEASTIRFSMHTTEQGVQNKTIKIKFKKERQSGNDSINNSNYSAYTVESVYQQQEVASPQASHDFAPRQRNGHNFHPYLLAHTSTPKASSASGNGVSAKRNKSKLKRINKFQAVGCSSSNSSSAENCADAAGVPATVNGTAAHAHIEQAIHNAAFNDNANYSFSSAAALDNSNCSISSAVGRLNFRDASIAGVGANNNNNNNSTMVPADFSTYQENSYFATQHDTEAKERRLQKALEAIERHLAKEAIDPFNSELCRAFLTRLDFPGTDDAHANYKIIQTPLPKIANTRTLCLPDGLQFQIDKEVGRGSYGSVYKANDVRTGSVVALKFQKPPNSWEIYICDQVLKRIQEPSILPGLMDISTAIIAPNASLIATEFSPFGSLLDINNKIRQNTTKVMHESLVMHFSAQICSIIHHLHMHKIVHADIKPDNFLLMRIPSTDLQIPSLRLIDFGCAIDMTLFPDADKTKFRKVIQTDGFTCIEMQEGRPWSYETDLFCIAGTVHVMLLGEYMQLQKRGANWDIKQKLPRYLKKHVWGKFYGDLLNIKAGKLPNLLEMHELFEQESYRMDSELQKQIRTLSNILYGR